MNFFFHDGRIVLELSCLTNLNCSIVFTVAKWFANILDLFGMFYLHEESGD